MQKHITYYIYILLGSIFVWFLLWQISFFIQDTPLYIKIHTATKINLWEHNKIQRILSFSKKNHLSQEAILKFAKKNNYLHTFHPSNDVWGDHEGSILEINSSKIDIFLLNQIDSTVYIYFDVSNVIEKIEIIDLLPRLFFQNFVEKSIWWEREAVD